MECNLTDKDRQADGVRCKGMNCRPCKEFWDKKEGKDKRNYIITKKHILFGVWFIVDEVQCTEEEMLEIVQENDLATTRIIEGDFVKFRVETTIDKETKEEIFRKHSQGSVFHGQENNQSSI